MSNSSEDATELTIDLSATTTQPPSIDPAVLRRAMRYGQRVQSQFQGRPFRDVEAELRAGWVKRGETTEWEWVQAAVRVGYELEPDEA